MKKLLLILFLVTFSFKPMAYELIDYQDPSENEQREFYIGDKIFIATSGYIKTCLVPLRELVNTRKVLGNRYTHTYKRNIPICKENIEDKLYKPTYHNYYYGGSAFANELTQQLAVTIKEKNGRFTICQRLLGKKGCIKDLSAQDIKIDDSVFVHSPGYSVKSISFLGKSRGLLKFTYEEVFDSFDNPLLRTYLGGDSQTLQFEVDSSESKIFSFKGALFETVKESSSSINIKVIKGFPAN